MLRAMDSAVAGLRAHQNKLDVIGHNIANVNTAGYKAQSYNFKEAMYQTSTNSTSGSGSSNGSGGVNAAQYGYGTLMGSISVDMTASTPTQTSGLTATIDGEGFFITKAQNTAVEVDGSDATASSETVKGSSFEYTRVGLFKIDSDGYLVDCNSNNFVYGFRPGNALDGSDFDMANLQPIRVCTTEGDFADDSGTEIAVAASVKIDSEGKITIEIDRPGPDKVLTKSKYPTLVRDKDGKATPLATTPMGTSMKDEEGFEYIEYDDTSVTPSVKKLAWKVDNNGTTEYYEVKAKEETKEDGTKVLSPLLKSDSKNPVTGEKDPTGETEPTTETVEAVIGRVAVATFQNQEGMTKAGNGYYIASKTDNSGLCSVTGAGMGGTAGLMTGYVEASNVDLAKEFSDLITTQRGFQANTKIITVSDQILEELVNMKR